MVHDLQRANLNYPKFEDLSRNGTSQRVKLLGSELRKPNFFILGAPKCGTTSLAEWLGTHPNIFLSAVKEPHFFNTDDRRGVMTLATYEDLFRLARNWRGLRLCPPLRPCATFFCTSRRPDSSLFFAILLRWPQPCTRR
jgi:hypothetical protein